MRVDAELLDVVELLDQPAEVTEAVALESRKALTWSW